MQTNVFPTAAQAFGRGGEFGALTRAIGQGGAVESLADIAARTPVWDVLAHGTVAATPGAVALDGATRPIGRVLDGVVAYTREMAHGAAPSRIALGTDRESVALARVMSAWDAWGPRLLPPDLVPVADRPATVQAILDAYAGADTLAQSLDWLVLSPGWTNQLTAQAASRHLSPELVNGLIHEAEHFVRPFDAAEIATIGAAAALRIDPPLVAIDEGIANRLSSTPGALAHFARDVGLEEYLHPRAGLGNDSYVAQTAAIDRYAQLAGWNLDTNEGLEHARSVLRGGRVSGAPARIAEAIGSRHGLPPDAVARIEASIAEHPTDPGAVDAIVRASEAGRT